MGKAINYESFPKPYIIMIVNARIYIRTQSSLLLKNINSILMRDVCNLKCFHSKDKLSFYSTYAANIHKGEVVSNKI